MRKTLIGAVASAALVATSLAGVATAATRVDGNHFAASGLTQVSHGCADTRALPFSKPRFVVAKGPKKPPLGAYSAGWVTPGNTYGVGVTAHVADPATLDTLRIAVYSADADVEGIAVATYHAPDDDGVWKGIAQLGSDTAKGWHPVRATTAVYSWVHFVGDTIDREDPAGTLQDMTVRHGGSGAGAEVGFLFGCNGKCFFVDDFRVSTGDAGRVYDLGGYRSRTTLFTHSKARSKMTLNAGQRVKVTAKVRSVTGSRALTGKALVQSRPRTGKKWTVLDKRRVGRTGNITFKAAPRVSSVYRVVYAGVGKYEGSASPKLTILVRKRVNAGLVDRTVTRGHSFTATGKVAPSRASKITLERYLKGAWRVVKRGSTDGQGHFRISAVAKSLGASYWRVSARSGGGTLGAHSDVLKL
ncbi:MAG: hypothetical protein JWO76_3537, partial [Nocardioides sp.]|nr:hypothetical protein [Nocardioides sp.]